jgi:hypothetical protein
VAAKNFKHSFKVLVCFSSTILVPFASAPWLYCAVACFVGHCELSYGQGVSISLVRKTIGSQTRVVDV